MILWAVGRKVMHFPCKEEDEISIFSRSTSFNYASVVQ